MECCICDRKINQEETGEPYLPFKNKTICFGCYTDLPNEIYDMAGVGDGGLIHLVFFACLRSSHNRKVRASLKQNVKIFHKLIRKYKFKCVNCQTKEELTVDHIRPVSKGGTDDFSNLQILCKKCNSKKGAKWNV
jgi:hypothetical protein